MAGDRRVVRPASVAELAKFEAHDLVSCHDIVSRWLEAHPEHHAIRGWGATNEYIFDKHSIVDTGQEWIDVTPRVAHQGRCFFVHEGTEKNFWAVMPTQQVYIPDNFQADVDGYEGCDDTNSDYDDFSLQTY